jgi:hypothetical protein
MILLEVGITIYALKNIYIRIYSGQTTYHHSFPMYLRPDARIPECTADILDTTYHHSCHMYLRPEARVPAQVVAVPEADAAQAGHAQQHVLVVQVRHVQRVRELLQLAVHVRPQRLGPGPHALKSQRSKSSQYNSFV